MKTVLFLLALSLSAQALAQSSASKPAFSSAPPPPGLNDPGVKASAPADAASAAIVSSPATQEPTRMGDRPQVPVPAMHDPGASGNPRQAPPQVTVHQDGDNTVQEYRASGRVYMVVVTPKNGVPQTYDVDDQGRLHELNGAPKVGPVMYKVLEWGKSKPVEAAAGDGN